VRPLQTHKTKILGAVEVTTFGHKRYENAIGEINSPVYSIARSAIKEEEANHVGQSVVTSLEVLLKEL
jgi:adenosylhomocysteinase